MPLVAPWRGKDTKYNKKSEEKTSGRACLLAIIECTFHGTLAAAAIMKCQQLQLQPQFY